jgi:hypothetical protein
MRLTGASPSHMLHQDIGVWPNYGTTNTTLQAVPFSIGGGRQFQEAVAVTVATGLQLLGSSATPTRTHSRGGSSGWGSGHGRCKRG